MNGGGGNGGNNIVKYLTIDAVSAILNGAETSVVMVVP
jgi:hypothetical protein